MKRTLVLIVAFLTLTLVAPELASAQCPSERVMTRSVQPQIEQNLADASLRDANLMLLLDLARRDCLDADGQLVQALIDIYEQNGSNEHQLLSALILGEVGDPESLMQLYRLTDDEESDTVRRVTLAVLTSHQLVALK